ncbi:MAG: hypothetical protein IJ642_01230 [Oscillospiraceae bacterium]|nr:hypothetical protein [Oscillospiraceae bacterium]
MNHNFQIHFQLQELDKIVPWGDENHLSLHWYGLTDGLLWITAGNHTVYEYSQDAINFWNDDIKYNNYQISRFLQDFSATFPFICESVPKNIYDNIENFVPFTDKWKLLHEDLPDDVFDTWYFDEAYYPLIEWFYQQNSFDSGHLTGGPQIGAFRCGDMIKFWWDNHERTLKNGKNIWTAPKGCYEMQYADFIAEVQRFYTSFFQAMDVQVQNAVDKNWGNIQLDKPQLVKEHQTRKEGFQQKIQSLSNPPAFPRDWNQISALWKNCLDDLKKI